MQRPIAYPVPWRLDRGPRRRYRFTNVSDEPVHGVSLTLHGPGVMRATAPARLDPGDSLDARIAGRTLARDTILVVRWFRDDGVEYLWRVSF